MHHAACGGRHLALPLSAGLRHSTVDTGTEEWGHWGYCELELEMNRREQ